MGHYVDCSIRVGFRLKYEDMVKPFLHKIGEEFHMEPRFDQKTGKQIEDEKIVDKAGYNLYKIGDFEYRNVYDLFSTIGASCRCNCGVFGSACVAMEENDIVFTVKMPKEIDTGMPGMNSYGGSFLFKDIVILSDKLQELKRNLKSLGLEIGEPEVMLYWHHG